MPKVKKVSNDCFTNPHYRLFKLYLSMGGFWPTQNRKIQYLIRILQFIGIFSVTSLEVTYFINILGDLEKVLDCLPILFVAYVYYVFTFNGIYHFYLMKKILNNIQKNWKNIIDNNEFAILQKYSIKGHKLSKLYTVAMIMAIVLFASTPFIENNLDSNSTNDSIPVNLLEANYYIDPQKYYIYIYIHELQATSLIILSYLSWDTCYLTFVQHSCSMFKILGYRLKMIGENYIKILSQLHDCKQDEFVCDEIKQCIWYHCECIRLAEQIENYYSFSWLMQVFVNMLILSICGSRVINYSDQLEPIFKFGLIAITCSFRLFYVCLSGENVFYSSLKIHKYICRMPWYIFSPNARKLMVLLLIRSSKPCVITMGRMLTLNFESYRMLIQMSVSYFTMILSTQEK